MNQVFRRSIGIFTAIIFIMCSFAVSAANTSVTVETSAINDENEFDASVVISNNPGFAAFNFRIEYDPGFMTPSFLERGHALYDGSLTDNLSSLAEHLQVYFVHNVNIDGDGEMLNVRFKISDDAEGTSLIKITYENSFFIDQNSMDLIVEIIDGKVTVVHSKGNEASNQNPTPDVPDTTPSDTLYPSGNGVDNLFIISYEANGGSVIRDTPIDDGFVLAIPPSPIKEGFAFDGWYLDAELTQKYDFNTVVTSDFTLYAKWIEIEIETIPPIIWENPFSDVDESDWFYKDVEYAVTNGLFNGMSATTFEPNTAMSRAMFVTVLYRMQEAVPVIAYNNAFVDVDNNMYYADAVKWAASNGIVNGVNDKLFAPNAEITREQMAAILYRYEQFSGKIPQDILMDREFSDWNSISDYAKNAVNVLVIQSIINGKPVNIFDPQGTATRAEVAAILHRFIEAVDSTITSS